ncbi:selenoprotein M, putative [Bodo saltans]|uniref:Selenoprotein M, putative n=1 Tax=Bodo saltans TaxID=75058 RepID=A0A0S4J2U6_BODSA|nr:selenoprotein M, putative [Bodo saltans]|eukprot:CUG60874.1 selenoprotein M, putative [Bodo saltans]
MFLLRVITLAVVAVALVAGAQPTSSDPRDAGPIVGARVKTCSGCRLNSLTEVRRFIKDEMRRYPAIDLQYIGGHDPIIEFVNRYNRVVLREEMSPYSIRELHTLVQNHGIHTYTPKPSFDPFPFSPVGVCNAWRQTGGCDPNGPREAMSDESCLDDIDVGRSGYCDCAEGVRHGFACDHVPFTCKAVCEDPSIVTVKPMVQEPSPVTAEDLEVLPTDDDQQERKQQEQQQQHSEEL